MSMEIQCMYTDSMEVQCMYTDSMESQCMYTDFKDLMQSILVGQWNPEKDY
jgi:hypothetical protein